MRVSVCNNLVRMAYNHSGQNVADVNYIGTLAEILCHSLSVDTIVCQC